jgi:hypothetical protein
MPAGFMPRGHFFRLSHVQGRAVNETGRFFVGALNSATITNSHAIFFDSKRPQVISWQTQKISMLLFLKFFLSKSH